VWYEITARMSRCVVLLLHRRIDTHFPALVAVAIYLAHKYRIERVLKLLRCDWLSHTQSFVECMYCAAMGDSVPHTKSHLE
jgi:hypothetical protein